LQKFGTKEVVTEMEDESNAGMILDQSQSHIGLKGSILMQGGGMADQNSANF
jgi:hypothetical protein